MWQSVQKNSTDVTGNVEEAYLSRHREANEEESSTPGFHVCESQAKGKVQLVPYCSHQDFSWALEPSGALLA